MFDAIKRRINIKYFMVGYLGLLLVYSSLTLNQPLWIWRGVLIVILYSGSDLLWTRLRDKTWYLPTSSWISGLILSLVAMPDAPLYFIILFPVVAVAGKQLLHFGKMRHVFNPASFSMAMFAFLAPVAWWGVVGDLPLVIAIALAGLFIVWRQERWQTVGSFFVTFATLLSIYSLWKGAGLSEILLGLLMVFLNGFIVFFATVMLIEPITSGFPTRNAKIMYGALVGLFAWIFTLFAGLIPHAQIDPLIIGLLLGNFICAMSFLPSKTASAKT